MQIEHGLFLSLAMFRIYTVIYIFYVLTIIVFILFIHYILDIRHNLHIK